MVINSIWFLGTFVKAAGECNQVIYDEAVVELCCPPNREEFDDRSTTRSGSTSSETVRDAIEHGEVILDMTLVNKEITEVRRVKSLRQSRSFRRSKSMGRDRDKELTSGSRPKKRSRTPQTRSTPRREEADKLQDASLAASRQEEPPATSKATRAFSAFRRRAGGKSSKSMRKETKDNDKPTPVILGEAHPMNRKQLRRHKSSRSSPSKGEKVLDDNPSMEEAHPMTRKQSRRHKINRSSSFKGEKVLDDNQLMEEAHQISRWQLWRHRRSRSCASKGDKALDDNPPMEEEHPISRKQSRRHKSSRSSSSKRENVLGDNPPMEDHSIICEYEVLNEKSDIKKIAESPAFGSFFFISHMDGAYERREMAMI
jgi:hypothetical protein